MTDDNTPTTPGTPPPPEQPGGQPDWVTRGQAGGQGDGLDPKVGGLLSYLLGWIGGLIMFFTQKNPEVRFHGAQSVLMNIALVAVYIVLSILSAILAFGFGGFALFTLLYSLLGLGALVIWVIMCIKGYNLEHYKLPVIGDMAERWAASTSTST